MTERHAVLRALVVDDEAPARSELRYLLNEAGSVEVVGEAANAAEAMQLIGALHYDVVFLDVEMPGLSGVQLAAALRASDDPPAVVFVTAYSEHAVEAFEVAAADYLVKPVQAERLRQALDRLEATSRRTAPPGPSPTVADAVRVDAVPVQKGGRTLLIAADDILYATAYDDYAHVHTRQGRFLCNLSLLELQMRLVRRRFLRVHRRYLVNLARVREVAPQYGGSLLLTLDDESATLVPVSRRRAAQVRKALGI